MYSNSDAPRKGIHAGGFVGLLSDAALLRVELLADEAASSVPAAEAFTSDIAATAFRMCTKWFAPSVKDVRSLNIR